MSEVPVETRKSFRWLMAAVFAVVVALAGLALWFWMSRPCCAVPPPNSPLVAVPSGQAVHYLDTITNVPGQEGLTYRFRFVAPAISQNGGTMSAETSADDMLALCNTFAIPRLPTTGPIPNQIIITLTDRATKFGEPAPEATQFFEGYSIENGQCVWQLF